MRCYAFTNAETVVDDEAATVREWATRILRGDSLSSIVADARANDIRTVTGKHWRHTSLKRVLIHPRMRGTVIRAREYDKLVKKLEDRVPPSAPRRYLLSGGVARCGRCGNALTGQPTRNTPSYACRKQEEAGGGCGRIRMKAEWLETLVTDRVLDYLSSPHRRKVITPTLEELEAIPERIDDCRRRMSEVARDWADGLVDKAFRDQAVKVLQDKIDAMTEVQRQGADAAILADITPESLREWWRDAPIDRRRQLIRLVLIQVDVNPVDPDSNGSADRLGQGRLTYHWRHS